jgi:EAL domain-containing protein (putative c-di-GMP-specific phosphodiesterase class I)/GGDEF domain-containing protein
MSTLNPHTLSAGEENNISFNEQLILSKLLIYILKPELVYTKLKVNSALMNAVKDSPNLSKLRAKLTSWPSSENLSAFTNNINQLVSIWLSAIQQGADLQSIISLIRCFEIKSFGVSSSAKFHCFALELLTETSQQQQDLKLDYLLNYDADTQLPNANKMLANIDKAAALTQDNQYLGLFSIQFQLSKNNPVFSNQASSNLSKTIAEVLQINVPRDGSIYYNGQLQFDILLPNLSDEIKLTLLAAKLQRAFEQMTSVENQSVLATPFIGCAYDLKSAVNVADLLSCARLALENALSNQQGLVIYSDALKAHLDTQNELENRVLEAFNNDSLTLYLQPVVNLKDSSCAGAELLLRLTEQSKFSIHPGLMVEILNKVGRGKLFTRWLINSACRYAAELKYEHKLDLYLTVNLRAEDLYDFELPHMLLQAIALWKLSPSNLVLEVTENGVLELNEATNSVINELAKSGFKLALDDFGTGYSSLSRLRTMPIDIIKIDQTFVRDISNSKHDYEIVKSIAALATSLGKDVIAEGVEDKTSLDLIKKMKISKCQGYFFAKPMPIEKFVTWVKQR